MQSSDTERYKNIGSAIKVARYEADMSYKEVGKAMSRTATAVLYWENGERKISISQLEKLASLFGKPLSYFLKFTSDEWGPRGKYLTKVINLVSYSANELKKSGIAINPIRDESGKPSLTNLARLYHRVRMNAQVTNINEACHGGIKSGDDLVDLYYLYLLDE